MAITNALGQDGGSGTQVLVSTGGATAPVFADVETAALPIISGATYNTIGEFNIATGTSGVITGCGISDGGSGTLDVASGSVMIRTTASDIGVILSADFAGDTGVALTDNSINFVYIDYNGGTPIVDVRTVPNATPQDFVVLGIVWREGTDIFISEVNIPTGQTGQKLARRLALVDGVTRQSGGVVGESGTNNVTLTSGSFWLALDTYATSSIDTSSSGSWIGYYRDAGSGWTAQASQTTISNLLYDNDSGTLATLANNQYGVHWVYVSIEDQIYVVYGQDTYNLTEAENALAPATLPLQLSPLHAILLAKIIIRKSESSFTEIESAFDKVFQSGLASDHADLSGLQGGTTDEYYHLTSAEYGLTGVLTGNGGSIMSASTVTQHSILLGGASNAVADTAAPGDGQILTGAASAAPNLLTAWMQSGINCFFWNLSFTHAAGTMTLAGSDGTALSATNPGYVIMPSNATEGRMVLHKVVANDTLTVSAMTGSLFGTTTAIAWADALPLYVGFMADSSDANLEPIISRLPHIGVSPASSANIGDPSSATADVEYSVFAWNDITEGDYQDMQVGLIGSVRATKAVTTNAWTLTALDSKDGAGRFNDNRPHVMPLAQNGAAAGTVIFINGGVAAPTFSVTEYQYVIQRDGVCNVIMHIAGDGGTDGNGAVETLVALPYAADNIVSTDYQPCGSFVCTSATGGDQVGVATTKPNSNAHGCHPIESSGGSVLNGDFTAGGRYIYMSLTYPVATV